MSSSLLQGLREWLTCFSKPLFVYHPEFLSFVGAIGVGLVIFALSQAPRSWREAMILERRIGRRKKFHMEEIKYYQGIRGDLQLLNFIQSIGIFYFPSITLLLILLAFPVSENLNPGALYVSIANTAYFFLFLPTFSICGYYVYFKLFRYRLH